MAGALERTLKAGGAAYLAYVSIRLLGEAFRSDDAVAGSRSVDRLGDSAAADQRRGFMLPKPARVRLRDARTIEDRIGYMRELIRAGGTDPRVRELASAILSRRCGDGFCVPEKDWTAEARAIHQFVRKNVRYQRDPLRADAFTSPSRTLDMEAGDCDDHAILIGSLLESAGHHAGLRVIQSKWAESWNHVYALVGLPPGGPTRWVPMDTTEPHPFGWEAPGAAEAERTGQPSGIVTRAKTFEV